MGIWLIIWLYIYKIYQQYGLKLKSIKLAKYSDDLLFQIHVQSVLSNKKGQKNQKMSRTSTCSIPRWVWRLLGRRLFAGRRGLRLRLRTCQRFSGPPWCSLVGQVPVRSGFVYGQPNYFFTSTTFSMNFYVVLHSLVILVFQTTIFLKHVGWNRFKKKIPWFFLPKKVGLRPWPWEIIHGNLRSRAGLAFSIGSPVWGLRRSLKKSWRILKDEIFFSLLEVVIQPLDVSNMWFLRRFNMLNHVNMFNRPETGFILCPVGYRDVRGSSRSWDLAIPAAARNGVWLEKLVPASQNYRATIYMITI